MPKELRIRRRARLRRKDAEELAVKLKAGLGLLLDAEQAVDCGDYDNCKVYIAGGRIVAFEHEGRGVPSLRLILEGLPERGYATVDMGAVQFVCNGADIMGPGIVEADPAISEGDLVWVREERHHKPLAVGIALIGGAAMARGKGKAIKSLHFIGDSLWEFEE